jgi:hypothetical protein
MERIRMSNATVVVQLKDLALLADLICQRDTGKVPPTIENIGACHEVVMRMMGEHVDQYYAPDDGSSAEKLVA